MNRLKSISYTTFMILVSLPLFLGLVITTLLSSIVFMITYGSVKRGFKDSISMFKDINNILW